MENRELEEKVMIMEELIQGFIKRIDGVESEAQTFFKSALVHHKQTLSEIADSVRKASHPQENHNLIRQIEELKRLLATMPKVFTVKNNHHFGAWSKSFIISITIAFLVTTLSFGTALHLENKNSQLKKEALNFWLVKALYPKVSLAVKKGLENDHNGFVKQAIKQMDRQKDIINVEIETAKCKNTKNDNK